MVSVSIYGLCFNVMLTEEAVGYIVVIYTTCLYASTNITFIGQIGVMRYTVIATLTSLRSPRVRNALKNSVMPNQTGPDLRGFGHATLSGM